MNSEKYIGLDVHQATISVAVLDSTGKFRNTQWRASRKAGSVLIASRTWLMPMTGSDGISLSAPKKSDPQSDVLPVVPVEEIAMTYSPICCG